MMITPQFPLVVQLALLLLSLLTVVEARMRGARNLGMDCAKCNDLSGMEIFESNGFTIRELCGA